MRVAFFGLGAMGMPMAAALAHAGHDLILWNRSRKRVTGFEGTVPRLAATPAEALRGVDAAITMLGDDQAVHDVVLRAGLLDALPADAVHVSMSTIGVATARHLTEMHVAKRQAFVSAPVFGRPDVARARQLWVAAAGPADALEKVRPLLQAVGRGISVVGATPWHANLVKLGNNMLLGGMLEGFGEVCALMRKAGVPPGVFLESANALFQSPVVAKYGALAAERRHEPALFRAPLGLKDLQLALAAAEDLEVPLPLAGLAHDSLEAAIAHGGADKDWSVLTSEAERRAGL
jgi:3-hydroxyisobutyrate dehydrogenase-like beta-hydroxyacid dehydrogenase